LRKWNHRNWFQKHPDNRGRRTCPGIHQQKESPRYKDILWK
jgi:hypothetical protein